jgi:hypothetical protein
MPCSHVRGMDVKLHAPSCVDLCGYTDAPPALPLRAKPCVRYSNIVKSHSAWYTHKTENITLRSSRLWSGIEFLSPKSNVDILQWSSSAVTNSPTGDTAVGFPVRFQIYTAASIKMTAFWDIEFWKQNASLKRQASSTRLHGAISQTTLVSYCLRQIIYSFYLAEIMELLIYYIYSRWQKISYRKCLQIVMI